jgi:hypothetical protein
MVNNVILFMPCPSNTEDRNLYKRGEALYFRMALAGPNGLVEVNQSLGRVDWNTARRVRDAPVQTLEGAALCERMGLAFEASPLAAEFGAEAMLRRTGVVARRKGLATVGEIITAFELDAAGRNVEAGSVYKAQAALRNVIKTARVTGREVANGLSSSILTAGLLQD